MRQSAIYLIPLLPLLGAAFNLLVGRKLPRGVVHTVAVGSVALSCAVAISVVFGQFWVFPPLLLVAGCALAMELLWRQRLSRLGFFFAAAGVAAGVAGIVAAVLGSWSPAPEGSLLGAFLQWKKTPGAEPVFEQTLYTWIEAGGFVVDLALRIDTLTSVMLLVITFVGTLIHVYSTGYMADEKRYAAYFGYLNLFTGSMLILVLAANLPVMFIGWEGVGLCSYLLIGFWFGDEANANAGRKAFVVNRIGDFAFLIGMFLLYWATKDLGFSRSLDFADLNNAANPDLQRAYVAGFWGGERFAMWAALFLFIGACGKSAQIPLYVWLPDAMAGPTPVSALIHAATMVTAGVYMVARMGLLFASSSTAMLIVATVGAATALFAALIAFAQTDFKKVLAYSTVSQLGFMFVGVGVGAHVAGIFHLVTHAFFKAGLFLAAGSVMHAMSGSGDIMKMGGLRGKLRWTHGVFVVYLLAIAGIFPFAGFFSKDEILAGAYGAGHDAWPAFYGEVLWLVLTLAALGTAFYMTRLYCLAFLGESRADPEVQAHVHESPPAMVVPLVVLAIFTAVIGFVGMPHVGGLHNYLGEWLAPSLHQFGYTDAQVAAYGAREVHGGLLVAFIVIALVVGAAGIGLALKLYGRGPSEAVDRLTASGLGRRLYVAAKDKFYVDELYDLIVVRPFRWLAHTLWDLADKFVIDTVFVRGIAFVVDIAGRIARWLQNGQVQRYVVAVVIGAAAIFFFTLWQLEAQIEFVDRGDRVQVQAAFGAGPSAEGATIEWDFDGDGEPDPGYAGQRAPVVPRAALETSGKATLWVTDGVFGKRVEVTRAFSPDALAPPPPELNVPGGTPGDTAGDNNGGAR